MKLNQSGLLFVPRRWQRVVFLRWLKRIHAWTGFWGALIFLLLGTSGVLLNHRSVMKIDTGKPVEVSSIVLPVSPVLITDEKALARWAKQELGLKSEGRPPRKEGGPGGGEEKQRFLGKDRAVAKPWAQAFGGPNGTVTVEYVPGSTSVAVKQEAQNVYGLIKNMHKGVGAGIPWVLFIDSIGGALIAMSLTGFLLWSRMHGTRLAAGGIVIVSLGLAAFGLAGSWV